MQVLALLSGLAYYQTSNKVETPDDIHTVAQNKAGVLFFLVISFTFGNVFVQCLVTSHFHY